MRCLLVSDLHYGLKQFDWVADVAPEFDVIVIAGDHLDVSGHVDGRAQIIVVLKYFQRLRALTRLIVSSGNHDLDAHHHSGEKIARWINRARALGVATDGDAELIDGTLFTVCPWWDGPETRAQVGAQLARDAERERERWIWVYHAPPAGSPTSWTGRRHAGDQDLNQWIEAFAPDVVVSGHIHEPPFVGGGSWADRIGTTLVLNSGRQLGPIPAHIVLDFDDGCATWVSLEGAETIALDGAGPLARPFCRLDTPPAWLRF